MACYDCEDCKLNYQKGGKCYRWEYDCPFSHLKHNTDNCDLDKALEIKTKLLEVKALWESMTHGWAYDKELCYLEGMIRELEDKLDSNLIEEWETITNSVG